MAQVLLSEMQDTQPGNGHIIKEKTDSLAKSYFIQE